VTKATLAGLVAVLVVAPSVLAPAAAFADRRPHDRGRSQRLHTVPPQRFFPHRFHGHGARFRVIAPPVVTYAVPSYAPPVYAPPVYAPPPVYYPPVYAPPPPAYAPPPMQTVIEFPTGRYELRGDGFTTPYRWVWIPNPPVAPPAEPEPEATPKAAPAPPEPARRTEFYRWTDDAGVVHLTDRWEKVPEAYRAKAVKSQS
jgi:hypothetical protein